MSQNTIYDGQFRRNVLIVGNTGYRKNYYGLNLAINNIFWKNVKAECISYIQLSKTREADIKSCFYCGLLFHYPQEHKKTDCLIVMDILSDLADHSNNFASFLIIARKYEYHCNCIFHISLAEKEIWRKITSQMNIFCIFSASVPLQTVGKILQANDVRTTAKYLPARSLWINKLFIELANRNEKICHKIDCSSVNRNGPGKFRTKAENPEKQVCYFDTQNGDQLLYFCK